MARKTKITSLEGRLETLQKDPLYERGIKLNEQVRKFFNAAFGRNLTGSLEWLECLIKAMRDGYSEEEIRVAYWVARCLTGKASWLSSGLRSELSPVIVLRHDGGINPTTGVAAKRWLDDLLMRRMEVSVPMVKALYDNLSPEMKESEREIIALMGVKLDG